MLNAKRDELRRTPIQSQTVEHVHILLSLVRIYADINVLTMNGVNGELLSQLTSEDDVKSLVGIDDSGDCTRVIQLVRRMASGRGIPVPVNIHRDGKDDLPHTWSVKQLAGHLAKNPALNYMQEVFLQHKLAGDIIMDMDLTAVAPILPLSGLQKMAFKKEITALRKTIAEGPKGAVAHGKFLCLFLSLKLQMLLLLPTRHQVCSVCVLSLLQCLSSCDLIRQIPVRTLSLALSALRLIVITHKLRVTGHSSIRSRATQA